MDPQIIKDMIAAGLPDADIVVAGDDGTHFEAIIISSEFADKSTLQQHQLVYKALGESMGTEIHALSMQTYTPESWQQEQSGNPGN